MREQNTGTAKLRTDGYPVIIYEALFVDSSSKMPLLS
jgi:hypothetical protein